MTDELVLRAEDGAAFEDAPDRGRVLVFGADTGGAYSLMEWTIAARPPSDEALAFGPHHHAAIDEIFIIRRGSLDFLVGDTITTLRANDVVRVPAGTRHGYLNRSGDDVDMMVMFSPGGFEELFVKYRTDQAESTGDGFVADALRLFDTTFEK